MMGNIMKMDFTVMKRYLYFIAFYAVFFPLCFQNSGYIGAITVLCVYIFVIGGVSVEERDKIHMLHKSLPVTARQIVGAKYLESLLVWVYAVTINTVVYFVLNRVVPAFQFESISLEMILGSLTMLLVFVGVSMPLVYKFGYMKARIFLILLWVAGSMLYPVFAVFSGNTGVVTELVYMPYVVTLAAAAVFYIISWLICVRIYENKSF